MFVWFHWHQRVCLPTVWYVRSYRKPLRPAVLDETHRDKPPFTEIRTSRLSHAYSHLKRECIRSSGAGEGLYYEVMLISSIKRCAVVTVMPLPFPFHSIPLLVLSTSFTEVSQAEVIPRAKLDEGNSYSSTNSVSSPDITEAITASHEATDVRFYRGDLLSS